jgi:hypothetical protein
MLYGANVYGAVVLGGSLGFPSLNVLYINVFDTVHVTDVITNWSFKSYINVFDNLTISEFIKMKQIAHVNVYDDIPIPTDLVTGIEYFIYSPSNFGPFGDDGEE